MKTRPKQFIAARDFSWGPHTFAAGEPVTSPKVLAAVLQLDGDFVVESTGGRAATKEGESADG